MNPSTEREIRGSFVNCSKGEASRLHLPREFDATRWQHLDYLGWRDPQAPARAYLVAEHDDALVGFVLRAPGGARPAVRGNAACARCARRCARATSN